MPDDIHPFNGEDIDADLGAAPFQLESQTTPSEQYNSFDYAEQSTDGFDGFDKVWNTLSPIIGRCIIVYSELESALEQNLYELINDRSDHWGMLVARQMTYIQKVNLYIDLLRIYRTQNESYQKDVSTLKKHLIRAAEIRNIIAHAKWPSITADGYVFSSIDAMDATHGVPDLHYYKLNKQPLELAFDYISAVGNMPHHIHEKYLEQ